MKINDKTIEDNGGIGLGSVVKMRTSGGDMIYLVARDERNHFCLVNLETNDIIYCGGLFDVLDFFNCYEWNKVNAEVNICRLANKEDSNDN